MLSLSNNTAKIAFLSTLAIFLSKKLSTKTKLIIALIVSYLGFDLAANG